MHEQYHIRKEHTIERIVLNMLETHRNIRELAAYYRVPKSTIHNWIKQAEKYLPYSVCRDLQNELNLHKRKQTNLWHYGDAMYYVINKDGPLD